MTDPEFEKRLFLSSVQLVRLNDKNKPTAIASGALIDYHGKRVLLTVWHATRDQARWAMQIAYVPGNGTKLHGLGAMNFLMKKSIAKPKSKPENIDFSYVGVPSNIRAFRQELNFPVNTIKAEIPITVHQPTLMDLPRSGENYGFCGMVSPAIENHFAKDYFSGEIRVYEGLQFLRTDNDLHYFSLPFPHPGHEHFEGCSGAPILDKNGALVGLLCGGDTGTNEVYAVSISAYKTPIDILVGNVS